MFEDSFREDMDMNGKMMTFSTTTMWTRGRLTLAAMVMLLAGLGLGATSVQHEQDEKSENAVPVRIFMTTDVAFQHEGEHGAGRFNIEYDIEGLVISVAMEDGESPTVTVNGERIPDDRIRRERGRLQILDEKGEVMQTLRVFGGANRWHKLRRLGEGGAPSMAFGMNPEEQKDLTWLGKLPSYGFDFEPPPVMLGIFTRETPAPLETHLHLEEASSVMIVSLHEGLPAHEAGLQQYDIIMRVDGQSPVSRRMIMQTLRGKQPGDDLEMEVVQAGSPRTFTVELAAFDAERMAEATLIGEPPYGPDRFFFRPDHRRGRRPPDFERIIVSPDGEDVFKLPDGNMIFTGEIEAVIRRISEPEAGTEGAKHEMELRLRKLEEQLQKLKPESPGPPRPPERKPERP